MQQHPYLKEVRHALRSQGFWGQTTAQFLEELTDHFEAKTEALAAQGHSPSAAARLAAEALGDPSVLAAGWNGIFRRRHLLTRFPWLAIVLAIPGFLLLSALTIFASYWLSGVDHYETTGSLRFFDSAGWLAVIRWTPWLLGLGLLAWQTAQAPRGWTWFLMGCAALGLIAGIFNVSVDLPKDGLRGMFGIDFKYPAGVAHLTQLLLPILGGSLLRWKCSRRETV